MRQIVFGQTKIGIRVIVGVISDTHGLLRPEAASTLDGVEHILHAGDVGTPEILDQLREIAPVTAVCGNIDKGEWASSLPDTEIVQLGDVHFYLLHDLNQLDLDPAIAGCAGVISGHTHEPCVKYDKGMLYLNPGSAGPRRFSLPVSLAFLHINDGSVSAEIHELNVG